MKRLLIGLLCLLLCLAQLPALAVGIDTLVDGAAGAIAVPSPAQLFASFGESLGTVTLDGYFTGEAIRFYDVEALMVRLFKAEMARAGAAQIDAPDDNAMLYEIGGARVLLVWFEADAQAVLLLESGRSYVAQAVDFEAQQLEPFPVADADGRETYGYVISAGDDATDADDATGAGDAVEAYTFRLDGECYAPEAGACRAVFRLNGGAPTQMNASASYQSSDGYDRYTIGGVSDVSQEAIGFNLYQGAYAAGDAYSLTDFNNGERTDAGKSPRGFTVYSDRIQGFAPGSVHYGTDTIYDFMGEPYFEAFDLKVLGLGRNWAAFALYLRAHDPDGNTYEYELAFASGAGEAGAASDAGGSGIEVSRNCSICHGSGVCQVCMGRGGMSYTTYGQGGSGKVTCEGCHGSRSCKYCGGTGKAS